MRRCQECRLWIDTLVMVRPPEGKAVFRARHTAVRAVPSLKAHARGSRKTGLAENHSDRGPSL